MSLGSCCEQAQFYGGNGGEMLVWKALWGSWHVVSRPNTAAGMGVNVGMQSTLEAGMSFPIAETTVVSRPV